MISNPNPLGKQTSDCVVRAIAIATDASWRRVYTDLCNLGGIECEMPTTNVVWGIHLNELGGRQFGSFSCRKAVRSALRFAPSARNFQRECT